MKIVSKNTNEFYPELIASLGLPNALQTALRETGSALTVAELDPEIRFVIYARVEAGRRFSQVYIAAEERLFLFDFWARGVMLGRAKTPHLSETARAIVRWVSSTCTIAELAAAFAFVAVTPTAEAYERGDEVEERWRSYISGIGFPELADFVDAASQRPELRQLFSYTSLDNFCFSRCTGYPFTADTPVVRPARKGQYEVVSRSGAVLGCGFAAKAAELVIANLPPGCGPAVPGTADDIGCAEPETAPDLGST